MPSRILVVDDDERLVEALVTLLRGAGYEADGTLDAEAALEKFRERTYHLVLTDLQLG